MSYISKRAPRAKQAEAIEKSRGKRAFALLMAMRTGKTKVIADTWGEMATTGECLDLLVIAPAGAYLEWSRNLPLDFPDELAKRTQIMVWVSGKMNSRKARAVIDWFLGYDGPRVLIVNAEAISSVKAARDLIISFVSERRDQVMAVYDEAVGIKNPDAAVTKFVVWEVGPRVGWRRILSGLLTPRSPLDAYAPFKFLDSSILGFNKFSLFRARYAKVRQTCMLPTAVVEAKFRSLVDLRNVEVLNDATIGDRLEAVMPEINAEGMKRTELIETLGAAVDSMSRDRMIEAIPRLGGYVPSVPVIESFDNVEELHDKIAPHAFRVRLEDCYDMPPSDYSFRDVEMTDEQRRIYEDLKRFATAELSSGDHVTADLVITKMLRLHQVLCGHTRDEKKNWHAIPEKRTAALIELLSDYDGKAVVWCSYDADVRKVSAAIEKEFGEGSVARFWGGNVKTRESEEVSFKTEARCRFMVATPDAGRFSRTWDMADLVAYYSSRNDLDHRSQSEERVKNVGKARPVAYVDFRVPGTVEDKIIAALRAKIDMAAVINGDNWREWLI